MTATRLGWQMEANWTDPLLFLIYSVAKPLASALILVVMLDVISGGGQAASTAPSSIVGSALWSFVLSRRQRPRLVDPRRPRALPDAQVRLRQPERLPRRRASAAASPGSGSARWGPRSRSASAILFLGVPFDLGAVDWALLVVVMALGLISILAIGLLLAAICMQTRQESWSYPEAVGRRAVPGLRRRLPARRPAADRSRRSGC